MLKGNTFNGPLYTWITSGGATFHIGFLIDPLSALMMVVVTFVSLVVHVYTIGYMDDDPGYQRFFSYISLFTFSMLMLVMANNFLQLFFGWEAVGLISYLLIGFWYTRPTAIFANLKAFLVNRVGDFGFLLGHCAGTGVHGQPGLRRGLRRPRPSSPSTTIEIFPGAPWLADDRDLHPAVHRRDGQVGAVPAARVAARLDGRPDADLRADPRRDDGDGRASSWSRACRRCSSCRPTALSVVLIIGAITAFFMGLVGIVQNDIKRVVAYSTLSQLGYMTVALGASAYAAGMFHLMTHAFFKALLFLAAGSVIIAMHHEQDMRKMGGLRKYMPITYWTAVIGALALCGIPPFAGFFSKDSDHRGGAASRTTPGAGIAYAAVLSGVFVTALYTFRMIFMTFHGKERFTGQHGDHAHGSRSRPRRPRTTSMAMHGGAPHESPWVVTVPLILLAIPSIYAGWAYVGPLLFGGFFGDSIVVDRAARPSLAKLGEEFHGVAGVRAARPDRDCRSGWRWPAS